MSSDTALSKSATITSWVAQVTAALILLQTLFFKFSADTMAVHIFETLGAEPVGHIATGVAELIVGVLLLIPRTAALGGLGAVGLMVGAIGSHLFTDLGIAVTVPGEKPVYDLFVMAVITLVAGFVVVGLRRRQLPFIGAKL